MGFYINMKIPANCRICPCADIEYNDCNLMPGTQIDWEKRLPDCPLIEVPSHGDLIDRDDYKLAVMSNIWRNPSVPIVVNITADMMPIIIPADKEELND